MQSLNLVFEDGTITSYTIVGWTEPEYDEEQDEIISRPVVWRPEHYASVWGLDKTDADELENLKETYVSED